MPIFSETLTHLVYQYPYCPSIICICKSQVATQKLYKPSAMPTRRIMKHTSQAIPHCINTTRTAFFVPISLRTAAIAATHGVYSRENTKKITAVNGVNKVSNGCPANNTFKVLTTLSLAVKPVIKAVKIRNLR